jgi:hypothetical protein
MKKQGPPPWGRKMAGWRLVLVGIGLSSIEPGRKTAQPEY